MLTKDSAQVPGFFNSKCVLMLRSSFCCVMGMGAAHLANSGCCLERYVLNVTSLFVSLQLLFIKGHKSEPEIGQICRKALPAHAPLL